MNPENEKGAPFDEPITPFEKAIKEVAEKNEQPWIKVNSDGSNLPDINDYSIVYELGSVKDGVIVAQPGCRLHPFDFRNIHKSDRWTHFRPVSDQVLQTNEKAKSAEQYNECPPHAAGLLADIDIFRMLRQPNEAINRIDLFVKSHTEPLQSHISELEAEVKTGLEVGLKLLKLNEELEVKVKRYEEALKEITQLSNSKSAHTGSWYFNASVSIATEALNHPE